MPDPAACRPLDRAARCLLVLAVLVLSGCGLFMRQPPTPAVPPAPPLPAVQNHFTLDERTQVVGQITWAPAQAGETLSELARRYDLGYDEIVAANPQLDPWTPEPGARVLLPTAHVLPDAPREGIVINLAARRLFFYPPPDASGVRTVRTHPVGIGREGWGTPHGQLKVAARHAAPTWTVPASILREHAAKGDPLPASVPPGPDNPLGTHALRLSNPSYLIHGTNKPAGIGMRVSHGCIQMLPEDIVPLYAAVPVGTPVHIVNQPYLAGMGDAGLVLEAHPPLDEHRPADAVAAAQAVVDAVAAGWGWPPDAVHAAAVAAVADAHAGLPLPVGSVGPPAEQVLARAPMAAIAPPLPQAPAGDGDWYVDLGTWQFPNNAARLVAMLRLQGPAIPAGSAVVPDGHAVWAGPFATRTQAQRAAARIERDLGVTPGDIARREPVPAQVQGTR